MPVNPGSGLFSRIWKFVDRFARDDEIMRSDLDAALDDFVPAINEALSGKADAEAAAEAAAASAAIAATVGAAAGAEAGANAAASAAAEQVGHAAAYADDARQYRDETQTAAAVAQQVHDALTTGDEGFTVKLGPGEWTTRKFSVQDGLTITNPDGHDGDPVFGLDKISVGQIDATGTLDGRKFLRDDGTWSYPRTGEWVDFGAGRAPNTNYTNTAKIERYLSISAIGGPGLWSLVLSAGPTAITKRNVAQITEGHAEVGHIFFAIPPGWVYSYELVGTGTSIVIWEEW